MSLYRHDLKSDVNIPVLYLGGDTPITPGYSVVCTEAKRANGFEVRQYSPPVPRIHCSGQENVNYSKPVRFIGSIFMNGSPCIHSDTVCTAEYSLMGVLKHSMAATNESITNPTGLHIHFVDTTWSGRIRLLGKQYGT